MCVLEAETMGLPIVAPYISELKTTVIDGVSGYLYNTDDECVDIVLRLLEDKIEYKKLQNKTLEFSKEYNNLENYKTKLKDIYNS